jgi:hypothetical protein
MSISRASGGQQIKTKIQRVSAITNARKKHYLLRNKGEISLSKRSLRGFWEGSGVAFTFRESRDLHG